MKELQLTINKLVTINKLRLPRRRQIPVLPTKNCACPAPDQKLGLQRVSALHLNEAALPVQK